MASSEKVIVLEVEVPAIYTADIDGLREFREHFDSESDFLLNTIRTDGVCRLRCEIEGEKDSDVVEVWGSIRSAKLADPSPGVTDEELAANGFRLMPYVCDVEIVAAASGGGGTSDG